MGRPASWCWILALLMLACSSPTPAPTPVTAPTPAASKPEESAPIEKIAAPSKPEIVPVRGDGTTVAPLIQRELERAKEDGRDLIVYVGATWCEPCQRFKNALKSGALDRDFPTLRLLEFDLDLDRTRLHAAGCQSRMIPLFALADADGNCTSARIEGATKGPTAVEQIRPRLSALLKR